MVSEGEAGSVLICDSALTHTFAVNDKHQFKRGDLLYRFRYDDGTFRRKHETTELVAKVSPCYLGWADHFTSGSLYL